MRRFIRPMACTLLAVLVMTAGVLPATAQTAKNLGSKTSAIEGMKSQVGQSSASYEAISQADRKQAEAEGNAVNAITAAERQELQVSLAQLITQIRDFLADLQTAKEKQMASLLKGTNGGTDDAAGDDIDTIDAQIAATQALLDQATITKVNVDSLASGAIGPGDTGPTPVPEPGQTMLFLLAASVLICVRGRRRQAR